MWPGERQHTPDGHREPRITFSDNVSHITQAVQSIRCPKIQKAYQEEHLKFIRQFCKENKKACVLETRLSKNNQKRLPLHVNGSIGQENAAILLDSGANISCVNSDVLKNIGAEIRATTALLTTAGKTPLKVLGRTSIEFHIATECFVHEVFVVKGLNCSLLLGNDFLSRYSTVLDYDKEIITMLVDGRSKVLPMMGNWEKTNSNKSENYELEAFTLQDVVLAPHTTVDVKIHTNKAVRDKMTFDIDVNPDLILKKGLHVTIPTTPPDNAECLNLNITNTTHVVTTLLNGTKIGNLIPDNDNKRPDVSKTGVLNPSLDISPISHDLHGDITDLGGNKIDINPQLTPSQLNSARQLIYAYRDIFAKNDTDLEEANIPPYKIHVKSNEPIALPPYKLGPREREELDRQVDGLLMAGVIENCQSEYAAPSFVVKKPGGKFRLVHNYKKINEIIMDDKYPLPRIDAILETLEVASFYSQMDINQAFFQQPIAPEHRDYTSFITHKGLYRYTRLPQGMKTSPNAFQRSMNRVFAGLLYHGVVLYIDDLVAYGDTFESQLKSLEETFERLRAARLKLKTSKCHFFYQKINILGHEVQPDGVRPLQDNIRAIQDFPHPRKVKDVRSFLGTASYYRKFIPKYSEVAHPLIQLTKKEQCESRAFTWTQEHEEAFQALKTALTSPPLLAHFRDNLDTVVMCDASRLGVGGTLSQYQEDGTLRPVAYVSRTLKNTENRWTVSELELLSVVFVVNHFRSLLLGRHFTIFNDHACLQYYKNIKNLSSRLNRLALKLIDFDFTIKHKPGAAMRVPDGLSRNPLNIEIDNDDVAEELEINTISQVNICKLQMEDEFLLSIRNALLDPNDAPAKARRTSRQYVLKDDVLYYKSFMRNSTRLLLAIPVALVRDVLHAYHDSLTAGAHSGITKTVYKISRRYHWPTMNKDITAYVRSCLACQLRKSDKRKPAGLMQPISPPSTIPFSKIQIDYLGPLPRSNKKQYIIVATDVTTRYAVTKATEKADAKTTVKFILETILPRFGCVKEVQTDRGTHFTSDVFKQLLDALGITYCKSSAYRPQSQGLTERFNGTLLDMIHFYTNSHHTDWSKYVETVTFVYNSSIQESTKHSPFYLLHAYEPLHPIDLAILPKMPDNDVLEAIQKIHEVRDTIPAILKEAQERQKTRYDAGQVHRDYKPGDKILISTPYSGREGTKKLAPTYRGPFEITRKISDLNYEVHVQKAGKWVTDVVHIGRIKPYFDRN